MRPRTLIHAVLCFQLAAVCCAATAACGSERYRLSVVPSFHGSARVVAVLPIDLRHHHDRFERFARTRDVVGAVARDGHFEVLGPEEIRVTPTAPRPGRPLTGTTLAADAKREGYRYDEVLVLQVTAERSVRDVHRMVLLDTSTRGIPNGDHAVASMRSRRAVVSVSAILWHAASARVLARVETRFEEDLLGARPPGDDSPQLTAAVVKLTENMLRVVAARVARGGKLPSPPVRGFENPYALGGIEARPPSDSSSMASALAEEARTLDLLRRFDPELSAADARTLVTRPVGLHITNDLGPLRAGDFVLNVDGKKASLSLMSRHWRRLAPGQAMVLEILRGSDRLEVRLARGRTDGRPSLGWRHGSS